jgi:hypothetical protein
MHTDEQYHDSNKMREGATIESIESDIVIEIPFLIKVNTCFRIISTYSSTKGNADFSVLSDHGDYVGKNPCCICHDLTNEKSTMHQG